MSTEWSYVIAGVDGVDEGRSEALCTLGNGYLGVRGVRPEYRADGIHYPGTYAAGCFNRLRDTIDGQELETESMINLPNWLPWTMRVEDGDWLASDTVTRLSDVHRLDLRGGILIRHMRVRDSAGRVTAVMQRRFVHMRHPHVCGLQTTITPENWSGRLTIRSEIDADTTNAGVERYRKLSSRHYTIEFLSTPDNQSACCVVNTLQSRVRIAVAARSRMRGLRSKADARTTALATAASIGHEVVISVRAGEPVTHDTVAAIYTSRDRAISDPGQAATEQLMSLSDFDELYDTHTMAWRHVWQRFNFRLPGCPTPLVKGVRLNLFHVLQTLTAHSIDLDVGVPGRGLHGEAYRGHIFWDELFVLRTLSLRAPELCRALLLYRFRRLDAARRAAREIGKAGAMFPWQSGSDGREENQRIHLNPVSGRWLPDETVRQRHVGLAVAYNIWQYWQASGDAPFLEQYGAEMLVEIARFFADLTEYDHCRDRYVIRGVVGPDEFHTAYPAAKRPGIDNNAYTNVMTVWVLLRAIDALAALPRQRRDELEETLDLRAAEKHRWEEITRRMFVPFHSDGVIGQFEGYESLIELDWAAMRARYGDIRRLDRILEAEGDESNRYRLSKQADVLMLFYLLSADELGELFERLGYSLDRETIPRTVDFYLGRTSHGSSLSAVVHAWVLARSRRANAMDFFHKAVESDTAEELADTTAEGIHLGAMAGSIDVLERCFAGVETRQDALWVNPFWPPELGELEFDIVYRQHVLRLRISGASLRVTSLGGQPNPVPLRYRGRAVTIEPGSSVEL